MDEFRKGVLRAVDNLTLAFRNAGQAYAFLGSGREMIHVSENGSGLTAQFADLADEGWPPFEVRLPSGAEFQHAMSAQLSRVALWRVWRSEAEVVAELRSEPAALAFKTRSGGGFQARLDNNARVRVRGVPGGGTIMSIRQVREPEMIGEVLRARARRRADQPKQT